MTTVPDALKLATVADVDEALDRVVGRLKAAERGSQGVNVPACRLLIDVLLDRRLELVLARDLDRPEVAA